MTGWTTEDYKRARIAHALNYDGLVMKMKAGDYLAGSLKLNNAGFKAILDYFISTEEYEVCQELVDKRNK